MIAPAMGRLSKLRAAASSNESRARLGLSGHRGRAGISLTIFCAALLTLSLAAAPAFAEDTYARNYESQITGFGLVGGINIDPAGHPWIVDSDSSLIDEYAVFPSLTKIGEQDGQGHFREGRLSGYANAAIDGVNGYLYTADTGTGANIQVFDPTNFVEEWPISGGTGWVGIDNSGGPSNGRIYVATFGEPRVEAFEPGHVSAAFSCQPPACSYVEGNTIIGTPSGPFGPLYDIEIDGHGNIFVLPASGGVDEFKATGEFVREFSSEGESGFGIAVDPGNDHLLVFGSGTIITEYASSGEVVGHLREGAPGEELRGGSVFAGMAVNSAGYLYVPNGSVVDVFSPAFLLPQVAYEPVSNPARNSVTLNATIDPNGGGDITACHFEYGTDTTYGLGSVPCTPDPAANPPASNFKSPTQVHADLSGLTTETTYHYRLVASNAHVTQHGEDETYTPAPAVTNASTDSVSEIANTSATFNGSYTAEEGVQTEYWFEYGTTTNYGHKSAVANVPGAGSGTKAESVSTHVEGLDPGVFYHVRLVARNQYGTTKANDETFTTDQAPTINASSSSNVTATSADLHAEIDPHGFATTYRFEYGTTSSYGQSAPIPDGEIGAELNLAHAVEVHLSGLQGVQYHFRIVAENQWGTVTSEDQTFEFFPPGCPNSAVRQQTGSAYLPDCRAYELVSPGNANGTLLYAGGPNTGEATAPSRFSFTGNSNSLKGTNTIETAADLYTATRTDSGWESKYIGLPGDEAGCMGGPPNSPTSHVAFQSPPYLTNTVLTDPSMSRLLIWLDGTPMNCFLGRSPFYDNNWEKASPSNAPYMFNADGSINQRLPTSFAGGEEAVEALKCPYPNLDYVTPPCTGDITASADLSHFVFSSNKASFAEGGVVGAPGSAYDNDISTNTVSLISLDSAGHSIAQDPSFASVPSECDRENEVSCHVVIARGGKEEFIRFPAVSTDGSHVLMSTATARTYNCERGSSSPEPCQRFTDTPIHLYMRVNDAISYEPSRGEDGLNHAVKFLGMTPDGSKVFFTSEEQLTSEDKDTSTDLYMWSEASDSLTLVSKADNAGNGGEAGQSDGCNANASWTAKCDVQPYSNYQWTMLPGGEGGNGIADSAITPNGNIYFYSPEQLDGDRGNVGGQNLYVYHEGKAQFVATLEPEKKCRPADLLSAILCAEGPILRFEATPNDSRAAFLTTTQLTSYENAGHIEMYSYTPASGEIVCDSCRPDGKAPTDDVKASQDGRFITNDGRVFFSTADPLVAQDTNEGIDVYEYVDGRPQLITPGTGTATAAGGAVNISGFAEKPGLVGVSNDGTDVYFDTFDVLTSEDHNGNFLKFYDARVNGGFAQPTPVPPCKAAEECHGAGSSAPALPTQGTAVGISGGNAKQKTAAKKKHKAKKHKKAAKRHRARAAKSKGRAGK